MNDQVAAPVGASCAEAQLLSARFSCGVGWLMNTLLELDVRVSVVRRDWPRPTWLAREEGMELTEAAYQVLQGIMPVLQRRRTFTFQPGPEVLAEHYIHPFARHPERPTVVYVRDPRDSIFSWYRRFHRSEMSLTEYLTRPSVYHEGEGETSWLDMPPAHTWAVYHLFWLAMAECMNVVVVRYEDMKADALGETKRVLGHLGLRRTDGQIQQALELSSFERTKSVLEAAPVNAESAAPYAGRGKAGEWRETYTEAELSLFGGPASLVMQMLGYEQAQPTAHLSAGDLTFGALLDAPAPAARCVLQRAQADLQAGNPEAARQRLAGSIIGDFADPGHDGALLAALAALHWTRAIFTDSGMTAPTARRVLGLFAALHLRFRDDPYFQIAQMQELARWRPTLPAVFDRWAVVLHHLGRTGEAEGVLLRGCAGGADSALLRSNLAALYWAAGRQAQAFEQVGRGVILDPGHPVLCQNVAAMRAALGYAARAKAT